MNTLNEETIAELHYEPLQVFAGKIFRLPMPMAYTQVPTEDDPRGYVDLYGGDPETVYEISGNEGELIHYRALTCFYSHISIILETAGGDLSVSVVPDQRGIEICIDREDGSNPEEIKLPPATDFLMFLYEKSKEERKA